MTVLLTAIIYHLCTSLDRRNYTCRWLNHCEKQHLTLIYWNRGKQYVLWSRDRWCFPKRSWGKHQRSRDRKTYCFPRFPVNKRFVIYQLSNKNKRVIFKDFFNIQTFKQCRLQSSINFRFCYYRSTTYCCPLNARRQGNSKTCSRARDVLSSNQSTQKIDFDSWYITRPLVLASALASL